MEFWHTCFTISAMSFGGFDPILPSRGQTVARFRALEGFLIKGQKG